MSIKYYANRTQETSTSTGSGNLVLGGSPLGFRTFVSTIGASNSFTYYVYRQDTNFEWEIGVGYILSSGGINQLVRSRVVASSNGNTLVGFTSGTKYVEAIISEDRVNTSFINVEEKSSNFTAPYISATYIVDASTTGVVVSLPEVVNQDDPVILSFLLNKTVGSAYEQINAIQLVPSGSETIAGTTGVDVSILNDYLQIISVPSQTGWLLLDPIQDATNPYGNNGAVQFKSGTAFSGTDNLTWDSTNKLLIGNTGVAAADIVLPASSGQTGIFNQNLRDNDFRFAGSGNSHLLFVDGGLNRVSINTSSVTDTLSINASSGSGITVSKSGTGPNLVLNNTSTSGVTTNNAVGSVTFNGLNSTNTVVQYGKIYSVIENTTNSSEYSNVTIDTLNNGSIESIAVFSASGITLGSNSQNIDGVVLGAGSNNEGNNIVAGYFLNVCGENCVVIGDNTTVSSGTFGGAIGSDHSVSGNNIWVFGGSGISVSGTNKTILGLDEDNYLQIINSGNLKYTTLTDSDVTFTIENISTLLSGVNQNISFTFLNNAAVVKTGLTITSNISDVTSGSEDSAYTAKVLSAGSQISVLNLSADKVIVGENNVSGNNIVFGIDNTISNSGNIIVGSDIIGTGYNNILIGNNIELMASGTGITVIGKDNTCLSSGNLGVVIVGNGNESNEDYSICVGIDNANSGLYSVSCGYMNGAHGDYTVSIGESNLVQSHYSVAIGRNNTLGATDISASLFALGVGNSGSVSNTGIIVGYLNDLYGSGGLIIGSDCSISGNNNVIIGNSINYSGINNTIISGVTTSLLGTSVVVSGSSDLDIIFNSGNRINFASTGIDIYGSKINSYVNSGNYIAINNTGLTIRGSGANIILSSGSIAIGHSSPSHVIDIQGDLKVNNTTGSGIVYANAPSVTGVSSGLFIENNIIKVGPNNNGVRVLTVSSGTLNLTTSDQSRQLINPSTYNPLNIYVSHTGAIVGKEFYIRNTSATPASYLINVYDTYSSTLLCALGTTNISCHVIFDGTQWRTVMLGS